jgi:hypothetical protein
VQKPFSKLQNFIQQAVAPNLTNKLTDDKPWINIKGNSVTFGGPGPTTDKEAGPNGYVEGLRLDKHGLVKDLIYGKFKAAVAAPSMQMCLIVSTSPLKVDALLTTGSWDANGGAHYSATDSGTGAFNVGDVTPGQHMDDGSYRIASEKSEWQSVKIASVGPPILVDVGTTGGGWDTNGGAHYSAADRGNGYIKVDDVYTGQFDNGTWRFGSVRHRVSSDTP